MNDQLVFMAEPAARRNDEPTSHEAALSLGDLSKLDRTILDLFHQYPTLTDEELSSLVPDWWAPTVWSCRSRLKKRGLVVRTNERRPSSRGRDQYAWTLAPEVES